MAPGGYRSIHGIIPTSSGAATSVVEVPSQNQWEIKEDDMALLGQHEGNGEGRAKVSMCSGGPWMGYE